MKPKKKPEAARLLDLRVVLWHDDSDILAYIREDAKRNERTLPAQIRFMLRRQMQAAQEQDDGR